MSVLENMFKKLIPTRIKIALAQKAVDRFKRTQEFGTISFSQEGEDILLKRLLGAKKENGFYIDVGAHHPKRFSNTYYFYCKGWRGINIDAMPDSMLAFQKDRPRDINLEMGVSEVQGELLYYIFNDPALNTFSKSEAQKKDALTGYEIIEKRTVATFRLEDILEKHLPSKQDINFMSIDVEGLDLEVIHSNNWKKFRPQLVLAEDLEKLSLQDLPQQSAIYKIMLQNDYELICKTVNTLFFKDKRS